MATLLLWSLINMRSNVAGAMALCLEINKEVKILLTQSSVKFTNTQKLHRIKMFRICRHLLNYCFTARKVLRVWRKLKPKETAHVEGPRTGPPGRTKELSSISPSRSVTYQTERKATF